MGHEDTLRVAEKLARLRGGGGWSVHAAAHLSKGCRGALKGQGPAGHSSGNASLDEAAHPALNLFSRTDSRVNGGHGEALGAPTMGCLGSEGVCLGLVLPTWPRPRGDT